VVFRQPGFLRRQTSINSTQKRNKGEVGVTRPTIPKNLNIAAMSRRWDSSFSPVEDRRRKDLPKDRHGSCDLRTIAIALGVCVVTIVVVALAFNLAMSGILGKQFGKYKTSSLSLVQEISSEILPGPPPDLPADLMDVCFLPAIKSNQTSYNQCWAYCNKAECCFLKSWDPNSCRGRNRMIEAVPEGRRCKEYLMHCSNLDKVL